MHCFNNVFKCALFLKSMFYLDSLRFYLMPFSCPERHPECHLAGSHCTSLASLDCGQFWYESCAICSWQFCERLVGHLSIKVHLISFLIRLWLGVLGWKTTWGKVPLVSLDSREKVAPVPFVTVRTFGLGEERDVLIDCLLLNTWKALETRLKGVIVKDRRTA